MAGWINVFVNESSLKSQKKSEFSISKWSFNDVIKSDHHETYSPLRKLIFLNQKKKVERIVLVFNHQNLE